MKLKKRKGSLMLEVLCSLMIISIFFSYFITILLENLKVKKYVEIKDNYCRILEAVAIELQYNTAYSKISEMKTSGMIYIPKENLKFETLEKEDITNCFTNKVQLEKPFVYIDIIQDKVMFLKAKMVFEFLNKEEYIECDFYKGNY